MNNEEIYFIENDITSEKIIEKIKNGKISEVFEGLCKISNDKIIIDYIYFKNFASKDTYNMITSIISKNIDILLSNNNGFIVHINMKSLSIKDVDKHKNYIQFISLFLKEKYPNKLLKCYIHNAPCFFSQVFNIISLFIDKDTLAKIQLIK